MSCGIKSGYTFREGFSAFDQQQEIDKLQSEWVNEGHGELEQARNIMTRFALANEQMAKKQQEYVDLTKSSEPYRDQIVKLKEGGYGYVTSSGGLRLISEDADGDKWSSVAGVRGCPAANESTMPQTNKSDLFREASNPLKAGGSCPPSGTNLQLMGATDPINNSSKWEGDRYCYKEQDDSLFETQNDIEGPYEEVSANCQVRAADNGRTAYSVYNSGDSYSCSISNPTTTWANIEEASKGRVPIISRQIGQPIFSKDLGRANIDDVKMRIMQDGQFVMGDKSQIHDGKYSLNKNKKIAGCSINNGAPITVTAATVAPGCFLATS